MRLIGTAMKQSFFLKNILILSVVTIILFPLYTIFIQYPSFTSLLQENTMNEAVHLAGRHELSSEALSGSMVHQLRDLEHDPHFIKINIYKPSGEVIYSTNANDIGTINTEEYFKEIVTAGVSKAIQVDKGNNTLEKRIFSSDAIETYVPIMSENKLVGVFEIYYDISQEKQKLHSLIKLSSGILFIMACILLTAVLFSTYKANKSIVAQKDAEEAKGKLIMELQDALTKVKKLSGLLPICASCKKIRDDKGYWNQIETYIGEHSEAEFSHGICPECMKKLYPEVYGKKFKDKED
jgi:hypothetical protein